MNRMVVDEDDSHELAQKNTTVYKSHEQVDDR
jgi:hypothetical protein